MNKKSIIWIIIFFLVIFVLIKFIFSQLCQPTQNNPIANIASSAIAGMGSASPISPATPVAPDPLSWEPFLERAVSFLSKACPRY